MSRIAGKLKQKRLPTTLVTVGDNVTISLNEDGTGTIEAVAERRSKLSRARPSPEGRSLSSDREHVLVANPDQVIFVFSVRKPEPNLRKLDRFLVVAERNELPAIICVTKVDLVPDISVARELFGLYEKIGYPVVYTSVVTGDGLDDLKARLKGKISVFAGSSGVGKTSLLNAIQPGLGLRVREVSRATGKGMHTTRHTELFRLDELGGYVADTPGIRGLALYGLEPEELDGYFREIAPLVSECQFSDCSHRHEPNCAVRRAVAEGRVSQERYESYLRLREEHEMLQESEY